MSRSEERGSAFISNGRLKNPFGSELIWEKVNWLLKWMDNGHRERWMAD